MAPTAKPRVPNKAASKHLKNTVRVPLVKHGQKRPHARSTSELAAKSKGALLGIVKDYAVSKAPKLIKSLALKTAIAKWIESIETLALGPHPEKTKKEDLVEAFGLKTTAPKTKGNKVGNDAPSKKPAQKKAASPTEDKEVEERNGTLNATFSTAFYPAQILDTRVPKLEEALVFFGTNIPLLPQGGQRYLYGAGTIEVTHTLNEQLTQEELLQGAEAYGLILRHLFPEE
ncbi:hypothetical protein BU25DRAFT_486860 [Macroventuria anomochaeta]|uniref:Uncharacterized protein n=1 Tax=Macroventuria anomochaeta TaxID=301207 RepID=A0ACB6SIN0_9PLEO|nr:uncharacterized protein BU25DRAFT_486860 [Macroventuria anomochaeta]KAF2633857.1 hypothetical protein BU25DRAFT_486860 [Macroventuria anomochaeta]